MLQRLIAAYQQFSHLTRITHAARRSVPLSIVALETRATPAVAPNYLPLIQPPEIVVMAPPQFVAPSSGAASSGVRADLFGVGAAMNPEHTDEWEVLFAEEHAAPPRPATAPATPPQTSDAAESDTEGTVIIEGETFLPYMD